MNIKSLLLGSMAAMCLLALPASAASDIAPFHPCPVASSPGSGTESITAFVDPGSGTGTITADEIGAKVAGDSGSVIAPPGIEGVVLASVIKPNNPMPLPDKVAKRTSAPAPGGTKIVQPASAYIPWTIDPGGTGGITPYPCGWGIQNGFDCFDTKGPGLV